MADAAAPTAATVVPWPDRLARWGFAILLLVSLLAWLPGILTLPPLDRDESRFAEASRQMVETGNFVDIRFASGPRYNKPIGIYWLQSASVTLCGSALGGRIWAYRLPSLAGGLLSLLFLYGFARGLASQKTALLASLLLGTTLLLTAESDIATTDAALLATVIAAQGAMMRVYVAAREQRRAPPFMLLFLGWTALAAGVLLKGPVILAVLGATALALSLWDRDAKWLAGTRPLMGAGVVVALVAPWAIAIGFASHGAFFRQSLGHDFAAKLLGGQESHGAPPGYYLALVSLACWPAVLLVFPALAAAIVRRRDPLFRYLLAWSGAVWLMFEVVPTKLPHYILPAYPALALLAALWATSERDEERGWQRPIRYVACVQFALGALVLAAACVVLPERFGGTLHWSVIAGTMAALVAAVYATVCLLRRRAHAAAMTAVACAVVFDLVLAFGVVPQLHALWLSPRAAELVGAHRRADDPPVTLTGYVEPSLLFLLGSHTRILTASAAAEMDAAEGGLALVEARVRGGFLAALARARASARPLGELSGIDYSTGRQQHLTLYRVTRSQRP